MVDEGPLVGRHKNPKGEVCEIPRRGLVTKHALLCHSDAMERKGAAGGVTRNLQKTSPIRLHIRMPIAFTGPSPFSIVLLSFPLRKPRSGDRKTPERGGFPYAMERQGAFCSLFFARWCSNPSRSRNPPVFPRWPLMLRS